MPDREARTVRCPSCGFEGAPSEYYLLYEATVSVDFTYLLGVEGEGGLWLICPRCGKAFQLPKGEAGATWGYEG